MGDLNATSATTIYRTLTRKLRDAHSLRPRGTGRIATFPSTMPVLRIDHVLTSRSIKIKAMKVVADPLARLASDHLPLVVDFSVVSEVDDISSRT